MLDGCCNGFGICVNRKLETNETFEAGWHLPVQPWWQWQQGTGSSLVVLVLFHAAVADVGAVLQQRHSAEEQDDGGDEEGAEHGHPLGPPEHIGGDQEDAPPERDLPKIVGVPRVPPQPCMHPGAPSFSVRIAPWVAVGGHTCTHAHVSLMQFELCNKIRIGEFYYKITS